MPPTRSCSRSRSHSHHRSHSHTHSHTLHYSQSPSQSHPQSSHHHSTPPTRREHAYNLRVSAAALAATRPHPTHLHNHDEHLYKDQQGNNTYLATFTKGLPHNPTTGLLLDHNDFALFVRAVNTGTPEHIRAIPLGPPHSTRRLYRSGMARSPAVAPRAWESMAAGHTFDLEGPDAQAVSMPPAPTLTSHELSMEMAEVYWMALLRDVPFIRFPSDPLLNHAASSLNRMCWMRYTRCGSTKLSKTERLRTRQPFTPHTVFRGITPGDNHGPYLSQFLLIGTPGLGGPHGVTDGYIQYGGQRIDQRVRVATPGIDFMTTWEAWLDVQNGADVRGRETYIEDSYRFITTPRDLATYVHYDALYQAYLNACIILLDLKAPFDEGLPFGADDTQDKQQGFATFGGPHILSLVTEVATRALKAVRFQKYNVHRRCRPEALGGLVERYHHDPHNPVFAPARNLYKALDGDLLNRVSAHNANLNRTVRDRGWPRCRDYDPSAETSGATRLLPMAFPEGSPMHPCYGAGHATVAGACVTILKAFFDHRWTLPFAFVPSPDGQELQGVSLDEPLTLEGELNKLASNISIGRDWAGVHYFSDYRESITMGESVALGILEEQKLTYLERFSMTIPLFDGSQRVI